MKKVLTLSALVCLALVLAIQPGSAQKTNPRIDAFFKMAEEATSFGPLAEWTLKQKYTDAEKKTMSDMLKKSPLGKKLQIRYDNERKTVDRRASSRIKARVQQAKSEQARKRTQRLVNYRTQAMTAVSNAKRPPVRPTFKSMMFSSAQIVSGTSGPPAEIEELDPAPPLVVGRRFNIIGRNFGGTRGRVVLIMGSRSHRGRVDMLDCTVDRWGNELIQATIPVLAEAWLDGREKTGVIWAKLAGGEIGPLQEVRVAPDYSLIVPEINRLSSETIEPGAVITITGESFCASPAGTVTFTLIDCDRSFGGEVDLWSDTAIRVVMPDNIEAVQPQRCRLEVTNHLGNRVERTIDFNPIWLTETLLAYHSLYWTNILNIWFGETHTYTDHDITLLNGWKVVRSYIDCDGMANHGCEHRAHPSEGDTRCASTVFLWRDGFADVNCNNCVEITGPKGFPYQ